MPECPPHHWLLDSPEGLEVPGVCMKCDETRTFPQTIYGRYGDTPAILPRDPLLKRSQVGGYGLPNY